MTNPTGPARRWRKSSYSGSGNNCVEVATGDLQVVVRDSKTPSGPEVTFTPDQWSAFLASIKDGQLDVA